MSVGLYCSPTVRYQLSSKVIASGAHVIAEACAGIAAISRDLFAYGGEIDIFEDDWRSLRLFRYMSVTSDDVGIVCTMRACASTRRVFAQWQLVPVYDVWPPALRDHTLDTLRLCLCASCALSHVRVRQLATDSVWRHYIGIGVVEHDVDVHASLSALVRRRQWRHVRQCERRVCLHGVK
jgi:hypothetical protein